MQLEKLIKLATKKLNIFMVMNFLKHGKAYIIDCDSEYKKIYPNNIGFIIDSQGKRAVSKEDLKNFNWFLKQCTKNNFDIVSVLEEVKKNNAPISFYSNRGRKLLKDSPFYLS